jgi:hypothetical protein
MPSAKKKVLRGPPKKPVTKRGKVMANEAKAAGAGLLDWYVSWYRNWCNSAQFDNCFV